MATCKILIHNQIAEIWVPRDVDKVRLANQTHNLVQNGYFVVIYRSGSADLEQMTSALLQLN